MAENTNPWTALFGSSKLKTHSGADLDSTTLSNKKGVLLYFSAGFAVAKLKIDITAEVSTYYKTYHEKFDFELVLISLDKTEAQFNEHWGKMPFPAVPYAEPQREALFKKYKIQGIPTLIVLDSTGNPITSGNAIGKVLESPEGFPWKPKPYEQIVTGNVKNGNGEDVSIESLKSNTALGFYFSAHWCPPCRQFTPVLVETYKKLKADGKKFEIIFASSDKDEHQFKEYFGSMPWLAFSFKDQRTAELSDLYQFQGIPTLIIVDPSTGKIINKDGRDAVSGDPNGAEFPWYPKPLNSIENAGGDLNDSTCLIYLNSKLTDEIKSNLHAASEHYVKQWESEGKDKPLNFYVGSTGNIAGRIKEFLKIDTDPVLVIIDLQEDKKDIIPIPNEPSVQDFKNVIEKYLSTNK